MHACHASHMQAMSPAANSPEPTPIESESPMVDTYASFNGSGSYGASHQYGYAGAGSPGGAWNQPMVPPAVTGSPGAGSAAANSALMLDFADEQLMQQLSAKMAPADPSLLAVSSTDDDGGATAGSLSSAKGGRRSSVVSADPSVSRQALHLPPRAPSFPSV
jgi:hypothetical protein